VLPAELRYRMCSQKATAPLELLSLLQGEQKEGAALCVPVELLRVPRKQLLHNSNARLPCLSGVYCVLCRQLQSAVCKLQACKGSFLSTTIWPTYLRMLNQQTDHYVCDLSSTCDLYIYVLFSTTVVFRRFSVSTKNNLVSFIRVFSCVCVSVCF